MTKKGLEKELSANMVCGETTERRLISRKKISILTIDGQNRTGFGRKRSMTHSHIAVHTLARKFDAVHSTTTIRSRQMPSVRLATPATPETGAVSTTPGVT